MAYFKDAQGDWMTQPAGMVPSWRGWARGPIGPSASYRMPPLTKMSGCGACGGLGQEESDTDYDVGTIDPVTGQVNENLPPVEQEGKITPAESEQLAKQWAAQKAAGGGAGIVVLLGLGAVALWMLFGRKARRNPCHRAGGRRNPSCSLCNGPLEFMGTLGNLRHFRCRNCGMWSSKKSQAKRKARSR